MRYVPISYEIKTLVPFERLPLLNFLEWAGRTCYKSDSEYTEETGSEFLKKIVKRGHLSVIEHVHITVKFICNRGVTHELVRHRIANFSQESTRFCNYSRDKYDNQITVIELPEKYFDDPEIRSEFDSAMEDAERHYLKLCELKVPAQIARNVLPINLKTEIVTTANLREWLHIFKMRCAPDAHPQIQKMTRLVLEEFKKVLPEIYGEVNYE
jgi:thymidylate synthase (FAD)